MMIRRGLPSHPLQLVFLRELSIVKGSVNYLNKKKFKLSLNSRQHFLKTAVLYET